MPSLIQTLTCLTLFYDGHFEHQYTLKKLLGIDHEFTKERLPHFAHHNVVDVNYDISQLVLDAISISGTE